METIASFYGYEISDQGKVYSVSHNWRGYGRRELQFTKDRDGYLCVRLTIGGIRKKIRVHRLVAKHYLPPRPSNDHELRHLNGDKYDNRAANLRWGTKKENAADRDRHGKTSCGEKHSIAVRRGQQLAVINGIKIGRPPDNLIPLCQTSNRNIYERPTICTTNERRRNQSVHPNNEHTKWQAMKVICTTIQDFTNGQALRLGLCEVGSTYTVIDECIGWGKDNTPVECYMLEEFSDEFVFDKRNFSPISDIDETTLVTEEFKERYLTPVNS